MVFPGAWPQAHSQELKLGLSGCHPPPPPPYSFQNILISLVPWFPPFPTQINQEQTRASKKNSTRKPRDSIPPHSNFSAQTRLNYTTHSS